METQRRIPWALIAIWLLASALAVLSCSLNYPSSRYKDEYLPVGNDAFYHARRIVDTVHDPKSFYEFDSKIHAPEGSLLVWPWGYDYAMATIVRGAMAVGISDDPVAILIWIPVAAVLLSVALLILIARQMALSNPVTLLAALCLALAPTTQLLHGLGQIDHHYAEFIFILAALAGGLGWLRSPKTPIYAAACAIALGLAPSVQNGSFILQLPLLATVFVLWLQKTSLPARSATVFAISLLTTTLAILLPSEPFQTGRFEFYTLSWFHLYIALCTAITIVLMSRLQPTRKGIVTLLGVSALLLIPIVKELSIAQSFIAGTPEYLQGIGEMRPPLKLAKIMGTVVLSNMYSYLIWITPLTAALCVFMAWRDRNSPRLLFWVTSLMGLALLSAQARMHYFGSFALYLPWLILLQDFCNQRPEHFKKAVLLAGLAMLLLYFPPLRHQLVMPMPLANDLSFRDTRPILATLSRACKDDPGIVLADADAGHYIRYYTDCSVIANNFLLTPQHFEKVNEVQHLLTLTARQLETEAPQVKYVLLRPFKIEQQKDGSLRFGFTVKQPRLANDLLLSPAATVPAEYQLLDEVRFPELNNAPYAKLYRVRGRDAHQTPPAGDVVE
ncbi:hypothetical protein [Peristeroidobacter soli]|uniref:hypothetical protein n=1 Tax=Peristeroidobacter soli TaxID=2497877 RepID=UPI00101DF9C8|nr:hypothetical protein [Peristeroidobacter soli]